MSNLRRVSIFNRLFLSLALLGGLAPVPKPSSSRISTIAGWGRSARQLLAPTQQAA
jgi:hypothetical protein